MEFHTEPSSHTWEDHVPQSHDWETTERRASQHSSQVAFTPKRPKQPPVTPSPTGDHRFIGHRDNRSRGTPALPLPYLAQVHRLNLRQPNQNLVLPRPTALVPEAPSRRCPERAWPAGAGQPSRVKGLEVVAVFPLFLWRSFQWPPIKDSDLRFGWTPPPPGNGSLRCMTLPQNSILSVEGFVSGFALVENSKRSGCAGEF
jgi:hypothetical protein